MCERNNSHRIDKCIRKLVDALRSHGGFQILASCCGHGRYPLTLIARMGWTDTAPIHDIVSGKHIPRRRNFYRRDADGFYYVPEVVSP